MSAFSKRIKMLQNTRNVFKKDIAATIGVTVRTYQYYESGERQPTLSILSSLADYFNVSIDYLAGRSDSTDSGISSIDKTLFVSTSKEKELLEDFRILNSNEQNIALGKVAEMVHNKEREQLLKSAQNRISEARKKDAEEKQQRFSDNK